MTRNLVSEKARALAAIGAEVVQGDVGEPASLRPIFAGAYGVFSVQNPMISGLEDEVRQGKHVADIAHEAGVQHLVYGSAGTGLPGTGIGSWSLGTSTAHAIHPAAHTVESWLHQQRNGDNDRA